MRGIGFGLSPARDRSFRHPRGNHRPRRRRRVGAGGRGDWEGFCKVARIAPPLSPMARGRDGAHQPRGRLRKLADNRQRRNVVNAFPLRRRRVQKRRRFQPCDWNFGFPLGLPLRNPARRPPEGVGAETMAAKPADIKNDAVKGRRTFTFTSARASGFRRRGKGRGVGRRPPHFAGAWNSKRINQHWRKHHGFGPQRRKVLAGGVASVSGRESLGSIELRDGEAVSISGAGERSFTHEGIRYHHILDPRTAHPAKEIWSAGAVVPSGETSGALSDIAATALALAETDSAAERMLSAFGISLAFRISSEGKIWTTPKMQKRLSQINGEK